MNTTTVTAKQISYIESLQRQTGRSWTEWVAAPEGAAIDQMPRQIASQVIDAMRALLPSKPKASKSLLGRTGQSGRCAECDAPLNHLSAGGYCFDCQ